MMSLIGRRPITKSIGANLLKEAQKALCPATTRRTKIPHQLIRTNIYQPALPRRFSHQFTGIKFPSFEDYASLGKRVVNHKGSQTITPTLIILSAMGMMHLHLYIKTEEDRQRISNEIYNSHQSLQSQINDLRKSVKRSSNRLEAQIDRSTQKSRGTTRRHSEKHTGYNKQILGELKKLRKMVGDPDNEEW